MFVCLRVCLFACLLGWLVGSLGWFGFFGLVGVGWFCLFVCFLACCVAYVCVGFSRMRSRRAPVWRSGVWG